MGQYLLGSPLVDNRSIMNVVKYRIVSGVVWSNRTMVGNNGCEVPSTRRCVIKPRSAARCCQHLQAAEEGSSGPRKPPWRTLLLPFWSSPLADLRVTPAPATPTSGRPGRRHWNHPLVPQEGIGLFARRAGHVHDDPALRNSALLRPKSMAALGATETWAPTLSSPLCAKHLNRCSSMELSAETLRYYDAKITNNGLMHVIITLLVFCIGMSIPKIYRENHGSRRQPTQGWGNGRFLREPADQRYHPARFPLAKVRERTQPGLESRSFRWFSGWRCWQQLAAAERDILTKARAGILTAAERDTFLVKVAKKISRLDSALFVSETRKSCFVFTELSSAPFSRHCGISYGPHPPNSPDLAPSFFHLFVKMKKHLQGILFPSDDELKDELTPATLRMSLSQWSGGIPLGLLVKTLTSKPKGHEFKTNKNKQSVSMVIELANFSGSTYGQNVAIDHMTSDSENELAQFTLQCMHCYWEPRAVHSGDGLGKEIALQHMGRSCRDLKNVRVRRPTVQARLYSLMHKYAYVNYACIGGLLSQWKATSGPPFSRRCQTPRGPMD
ncbi:hypothetical protein PR048_026178 [Dryococelus australis]|uniref:Uncharacterized protein n=1 Tax=Dryococelus australis TaxID=614101 RepID=A0ABQ9GKN8_9NEOP|nr:hypothetical protein PR048_026178 [Dryococelus australis]